jgi:RND family efflux transporter MFP subunit
MCLARWLLTLLFIVANNAYANEPLECLIEPHRLVAITSSEIGVLASVSVDEADVIHKGDIIAALRMDVENAVLEVTRARASANSEIELLRRDYEFNVRKNERVNELNDQPVFSAQDVDELRTARDAAWLRLQAAVEKQHTAQLEAARDELALARRIVRSPFDGVVVRRHKSAGEYVDGDPIAELAQLNPLRIRVVVPITKFGQIQVGMQATVLPELPIAGPFIATVTSIDPMMDAATATLGVLLSLPNPDYRLPPGLKCTLVLHPLVDPIANASSDINTDAAIYSTSAQTLSSSDMAPQLSAALKAMPNAKESPVALPIVPIVTTDSQSTNAANPHTSPTSVQGLNMQGGDSCLTLGPLQDTDVADTITAVLRADNVRFVRRYSVDSNIDGPWIVLSRKRHDNPPALIKRLSQFGITDYQWFRRGPFKDRMSFGRYIRHEYAQIRETKMLDLGFDVELVPHQSAKSIHWLDLAPDTNDPMHGSLVARVNDQYPELSVLPIACSQFANR